MSEFSGNLTPDQLRELREAVLAYRPDQPDQPVTPAPTSAADHAEIKRYDAIMKKNAALLTADERQFLITGIDAVRKTQW